LASLGVGILGTGEVAGEYIKAFRDHPATEIVGAYNRIGLLASLVGIYYTLIEPFSPSISKATWTASVAGMVGALVLLAAVAYVTGSRSGRKTSEEELLASLIPASENPAATPSGEVGGPS